MGKTKFIKASDINCEGRHNDRPKRGQTKTFVPTVTKGGVVLTARSLLLNQEVSFFIGKGGATKENTHWLHGSLVDALGLTPNNLFESFKGKTVLDLAGGASIAAEELVIAFGAEQVIVVDLFHKTYQTRMKKPYRESESRKKTNREAAVEAYVENLQGLRELIPSGEDQWEEVHETLVAKSNDIANIYFKKSDAPVQRMKGDATDMKEKRDATKLTKKGDAADMAVVETSSIDVVLNTWMLMYMSPNDRKKAIKEMVRVTKPGGSIRIVGGDLTCDGAYNSSKKGEEEKPPEGDEILAFSPKKFKEWFPGYHGPNNTHFGGKYVKVNSTLSPNDSKKGSLVVLDVYKKKEKKIKTKH